MSAEERKEHAAEQKRKMLAKRIAETEARVDRIFEHEGLPSETDTPQLKSNGKEQPQEPDWPDRTKDNEPKRTYRNARAAITALGVACSYDEFHDRMIVGGQIMQEWAGELSDAVTVVLRQLFIDTFGFDAGKDNIADAATALCLDNRFDPVRDYLDSLIWDDTARLDTWPITYLGAQDTKFNRAIGRLTLVAAVRRVRQPGCKFDHITTLERPEGTMKSTSIVTLAGGENFSDQTILSVRQRAARACARHMAF
jgi:Virulence-associated protein E